MMFCSILIYPLYAYVSVPVCLYTICGVCYIYLAQYYLVFETSRAPVERILKPDWDTQQCSSPRQNKPGCLTSPQQALQWLYLHPWFPDPQPSLPGSRAPAWGPRGIPGRAVPHAGTAGVWHAAPWRPSMIPQACANSSRVRGQGRLRVTEIRICQLEGNVQRSVCIVLEIWPILLFKASTFFKFFPLAFVWTCSILTRLLFFKLCHSRKQKISAFLVNQFSQPQSHTASLRPLGSSLPGEELGIGDGGMRAPAARPAPARWTWAHRWAACGAQMGRDWGQVCSMSCIFLKHQWYTRRGSPAPFI